MQNGWQALYLKSPGFSDEQTAFDMEDRLRRARLRCPRRRSKKELARKTHTTQDATDPLVVCPRIRILRPHRRGHQTSARKLQARPAVHPDAHRGRQAHARLADAVAQHHTEATIISRSTCLRCLRHAGRVCLVTRPWILRSGRSARNDASHQRINLAALRQGRRLIWHT